MKKFRFLEIKCIDEDTGKFVRIEDTTKSNPHMVFYRAADVDALFDDVRALVEKTKELREVLNTWHIHHGVSETTKRTRLMERSWQAIAAVERHFSNKNSKP